MKRVAMDRDASAIEFSKDGATAKGEPLIRFFRKVPVSRRGAGGSGGGRCSRRNVLSRCIVISTWP